MPLIIHQERAHSGPPPVVSGNQAWPGARYGMVISVEVAAALREGRPVVALESTIISHGMPYPQNLQTALEVEAVVRQGTRLEPVSFVNFHHVMRALRWGHSGVQIRAILGDVVSEVQVLDLA